MKNRGKGKKKSTKSFPSSSSTPLPPLLSNNVDHNSQENPNQVPNVLNMGLDLGGSLTKVCFFESYHQSNNNGNNNHNHPAVAGLATYVSTNKTFGDSGVRDETLSFESKKYGGRFHFIYFQTSHTSATIEMIKKLGNSEGTEVHATGGGAIKFAKLVEQELGIKLVAEDELEAVVRGIVFTLVEQPSTCYSLKSEGYDPPNQLDIKRIRIPRSIGLDELFPLLVVNIGSGVSIVKLESPTSMRRVSGTAVGGGTFFGLCKLLTRCETFEEAMDMADRGDSQQVNMLVSDIYGGSYDRVGLPGSITASFFGKAASATSRARPASSGSHEDVLTARRERSDPWWIQTIRTTAPYHVPASVFLGVIICDRYGLAAGLLLLSFCSIATLTILWMLKQNRQRRHFQMSQKQKSERVFQDEDIARALVTMVAQNITQVAFLNAKLHHTKRIVFTGNFLRHNTIALRTLTTNLDLFSGGEVEALFMKHEGFFGAIGAWLASEHAKELPIGDERGELPRTSSFHAPEEGDDVFFISSSPKLGVDREAPPRNKSRIDAISELRLT